MLLSVPSMHVDEILKNLPALFSALLISILFVQSGLDKVFDWKGNLGWLTGHFSKTFLAGMVPMMLATITVMELATGVLAAVGICYFLISGSLAVIFTASVVGAASITALFFGQPRSERLSGGRHFGAVFHFAYPVNVLDKAHALERKKSGFPRSFLIEMCAAYLAVSSVAAGCRRGRRSYFRPFFRHRHRLSFSTWGGRH